MAPLSLLAALFLAPAAAGQPDVQLPWRTDWLNESLAAVKAAKPGKTLLIVPVVAVVLDGATADEDRLSWELYMANYIYNGLDPIASGDKKAVAKKGTADCGIAFEFKGARRVSDPNLRQKLFHDDIGSARRPQTAYYSNLFRLSEEERAILDKVGPAPAGGVQILYIKDLDGGHGYTYNRLALSSALGRMKADALLPSGSTFESLFKAYERNILLSDIGKNDTAAHEIGHALTGRGHDDSPGNLMKTGGAGDGLLTESQCSSMRSRLRSGFPVPAAP